MLPKVFINRFYLTAKPQTNFLAISKFSIAILVNNNFKINNIHSKMSSVGGGAGSEDKFTLSYSKKEHNQRSRQQNNQGGSELNRDDLVMRYDGSIDSMKHFVGPAFLLCIISIY